MQHSGRKHAKLSASGSERWVNCPGSVKLSEGRPDKESIYSREGTLAHELLEAELFSRIFEGDPTFCPEPPWEGVDEDMRRHVRGVADFIYNLARRIPHAELLVEGKSDLSFISPDMWGTYDGAIIDLFGTLHVIDFKYGAGHVVSVRENLQAIFYALGLAHRFDWNFKRVRMWIIQPRVKGYDGPAYWECSIQELRGYVDFFKRAVDRVEKEPTTYVEGRWCYFCKGKSICPKIRERKLQEGKHVFSAVPKKLSP